VSSNIDAKFYLHAEYKTMNRPVGFDLNLIELKIEFWGILNQEKKKKKESWCGRMNVQN
jgi:hypothetical protein